MLPESAKLRAGDRVTVYRLPDAFLQEILRVPHDVADDAREIAHVQTLASHFDARFLPSPRVRAYDWGGCRRNLVVCEEVPTRRIADIPTSQGFAAHLDTECRSIDEKIAYVCSLRKFVDLCKRFYEETDALPDLAGRGNVVPFEDRVVILDFNNISFGREQVNSAKGVYVPVDDRGIPIFDLSLNLLYGIEKRVLSYVDTNVSTPGFTRVCGKEMTSQDMVALGPFVAREALIHDAFYGALRHKERREMVDALMHQHPLL